MAYFKDENSGLHWLSSEDIERGGLYLLPLGSVEITEDEADAIRAANATPQVITAEMVRAEGARRLALIGAPYSPEERETWSQQVTEAKAIQADANADAPLLTLLAAADGITVADMAATVLAKAEAFAAAAGAVLAAQRALLAMDPIPADYADASRWPG